MSGAWFTRANGSSVMVETEYHVFSIGMIPSPKLYKQEENNYTVTLNFQKPSNL